MADALAELEQVALSRDHVALFLGPFELLAPPYGSVWLEPGRRVMGKTTVEVARLYREAGLEVDATQPPDHIAIELEFLSYLVSKQAASIGRDDAQKWLELQQRFLEDALRPWMVPFCRAIRLHSASPFYSALATVLEVLVSAD